MTPGQSVFRPLRLAISNTDYYNNIEQSVRKTAVASATLGPLVEKSVAELKNSLEKGIVTMELLGRSVRNVKVWRESLRPHATDVFESELLKAFTKKRAMILWARRTIPPWSL